MNDSEKNLNLSDSMFNFDFIQSDDLGPEKNQTPSNDPPKSTSSFEQHSESKDTLFDGSVSDFEQIPSILNSLSPIDTDSQNRNCNLHQTSNNSSKPVAFDVQMESQATSYFSLPVMRDLLIVPAQYDSNEKTLTILCQNQTDEELPLKLEGLLICQYSVRIALQSETTETIEKLILRIENREREEQNDRLLESALADADSQSQPLNYLSNNVDSPIHNEKPSSDSSQNGKRQSEQYEVISGNEVKSQKILFVTPKGALSAHLVFALRAENIVPVIAENCDKALEEITKDRIGLALIHESFRGSSQALRTGLQNLVGSDEPIPVRYFSSEKGLITGDVYDTQMIDFFESNLRLNSYLSDVPEEALHAHAAAVSDLCAKLADHYSFSQSLRMALLSAAHWHDIALRDLKEPNNYSQSDIIPLSASRLESLDSPSEVISLLRIMSRPSQEHNDTDTDFALAGCILAVADYYCHQWPTPSALTKDQLTDVNRFMRQFSRSLAIPSVVSVALEIIEDSAGSQGEHGELYSVHILDMASENDSGFKFRLEGSLLSAGFGSSASTSTTEYFQLANDTDPQALIILHNGNVQEITDTLFALALQGVTFENTPTMLIVSEDNLDNVIWSIKHGIEDIFSMSVNPEILVTKIARSQKRLNDLSQVRLSVLQDMGTHGTLEDMNLIKLLQALRDSSRPLQLSITAHGKELVVFAEDNRVHFASCAELVGIEAIAQALDWNRGIWSIDPIEAKKLPQSNLGLTIDSVMLEACLQFDLATRVDSDN